MRSPRAFHAPLDQMSTFLQVRVQPRAKSSSIDGFRDGILRVRVTALPVEGAANAAVVALLADALDVPKSRLTVVKGQTGRVKLIAVEGISEGEVRSRLGIR